MKASEINSIFIEAIKDYHIKDNIDYQKPNKYSDNKFKGLLYQKNWIDTVQWHMEDIIRDPENAPETLVAIKRKIDASNQHRTDIVEEIDEYLFNMLSTVQVHAEAKLNSETPAWLLDRMSILQIKIYHFEEQLNRPEIDLNLLNSIKNKLFVLKIQESDLEMCYDELLADLTQGKKYMKLYKQMKMYNDPNLNPVFYNKK